MLECLECGAELVVPAQRALGDILTCAACGEAFIVVEVSPLEIDYPDDDEDWDGDWDEDVNKVGKDETADD